MDIIDAVIRLDELVDSTAPAGAVDAGIVDVVERFDPESYDYLMQCFGPKSQARIIQAQSAVSLSRAWGELGEGAPEPAE